MADVSEGASNELPAIELANYRFLSVLGRGGMGSVYLAEQQNPKRKVAVKVVAPDENIPRAFLDALKQEGDTAAQFEHDNLAHVYECGIVDDHYYLAMQYLAGGDLEHRLRQGMTLDEVRRVIVAIASALEHIHGKGFLHRDVKPANILFTEAGKPVLADFGIAKDADSVGVLTSAGYATGTPAYMSPEQIRGDDLDGRSDLYALGVVLYECLTGQLPFWSENDYELKRLQVEEPPPRLSGALASFQMILDGLLAKDRGDRYADAGQLIRDLEGMGRVTGQATLRQPSGPVTGPPPETPSPVTLWVREMSQRRVFRVLALYVALGWGLTEIINEVVDQIAVIPETVATFATMVFLAGLPVAIVLSWVYDWGPGGLRRVPTRHKGMLVGSVAVSILILYFLWPDPQPPPPDVETASVPQVVEPVVAFLPLANLSADGGLDYMGKAIAEELLNGLAVVPEVRIKGTASSFGMANLPPGEIARELGINRLVTGTFQLSGETIRISIRLLDAVADEVVWNQVFNDSVSNIYALQSEIARDMAAGLGFRHPDSASSPKRKVDPTAYRLYLEAREKYVNPFVDGPATIERLERVLELDPDFPQALAFRGYLDVGASWAMEDRNSPMMHTGTETLLRSLDLDPDQPEAYAALALAYALQYRWVEARQMADRAVELAGNRVMSPMFEFAYNNLDHRSKSVDIATRRFEDNPLDPQAIRNMMWVYNTLEDSEGVFQIAEMLDARGISYQSYHLGLAHAREGNLERAGELLQETTGRYGLPEELGPQIANALINGHDPQLVDMLLGMRDNPKMPLANYIWFAMTVGVDPDVVYELAGPAFRNYQLNPIAFYDRKMSAYRADERFVPLMEEMGLAQYWREVEAPDFCAFDPIPTICP